eukprot:1098209-Rhodomonas_salina.2
MHLGPRSREKALSSPACDLPPALHGPRSHPPHTLGTPRDNRRLSTTHGVTTAGSLHAHTA